MNRAGREREDFRWTNIINGIINLPFLGEREYVHVLLLRFSQKTRCFFTSFFRGFSYTTYASGGSWLSGQTCCSGNVGLKRKNMVVTIVSRHATTFECGLLRWDGESTSSAASTVCF